jgi:Putative DNA-binding domain
MRDKDGPKTIANSEVTPRPSLLNLEELLKAGEGPFTEFKRRLPSDNSVARTLTAFANSNGGVLLVGVDSDPEGTRVVGLSDEEARKTSSRLRRIASSLISAPVPVDEIEFGGRKIVFASVNPVPEPLRPARTSEGRAYVREGGQDRPIQQKKSKVKRRPSHECHVFVAMSFREEEEPALVDYFHAIKRAASRTRLGLRVHRMDEVEGDYEISQRIMDEIDDADVIVADFTLEPRNVYFELGYARGRRKQVIQTARKDTQLEFDIRSWRTIFYKNATELEEVLVPSLEEAYSAWLNDLP